MIETRLLTLISLQDDITHLNEGGNKARVKALESVLRELLDVIDDPTYMRDSFTTQPARAALAADTCPESLAVMIAKQSRRDAIRRDIVREFNEIKVRVEKLERKLHY